MPLKRYGKTSSGASRLKRAVGASDDVGKDSGGAKDDASRSADGDSQEPVAVEDPFSFDMDNEEEEEVDAASSSQAGNSRDAWDFTASTASTKNISPARPKANAAEERTRARQKLPHSTPAEKKAKTGAGAINSNFIGEFGQSRAKLDDVEFILDGLQSSQGADVRANSTAELAELCGDADTRVLLRSHALMPRVLSALHASARQEATVAMSGSAVLYLLCNDAANKELVSTAVCQTMVKLLACVPPSAASSSSAPKAGGGSSRPWSKKARAGASGAAGGEVGGKGQGGGADRGAYVKIVHRIAQVLEGHGCDIANGLEAAASSGDGAHGKSGAAGSGNGLLEEVLSAEHLVLCAATQLSTHQANFRDLFRAAGGLTACSTILADSLLALSLGGGGKVAVWRLVRDLKLLETLTFMSLENQNIVLEAQPGLVGGLLALIGTLTGAIKAEGSGGSSWECRLGAMKLLVNLTNHNAMGASQVRKAPGGVHTVLDLLHGCAGGESGGGMEEYDALTLGLGLVINCLETDAESRVLFGEWKGGAEEGEGAHSFLWRLFRSKVRQDAKKGLVDFNKMMVDQLVVAAYTSVLLGVSMKDCTANRRLLIQVEDWNALPLVQVLDYFIVCHEEADQGKTVTDEFIESLTEVLGLLKGLVDSQEAGGGNEWGRGRT